MADAVDWIDTQDAEFIDTVDAEFIDTESAAVTPVKVHHFFQLMVT